MPDNNFNYDSFVHNPPNPVDIENLSLHDSLFSSTSLTPPPFNSFNIFSFNINGLKMHSQNKIELLSNFFSLKQIFFSGVTHIHPKQMHFLAKRLSNYTVFSSTLDTSQHVRSSRGVSLFIKSSLASHVHTYTSHSSRLLSVDLYFKGNVKLRIFVIYIPPISDQALHDVTINLLIQALSEAKRLGFHHTICGDFNMHLDQFYPIFFNQPQIASKRVHRLFNFLYQMDTLILPQLISLLLWAPITVLTLLLALTMFARAHQLKQHSRRIFLFDSVTSSQWDDFSTHIDQLCNIPPPTYASWHVNRMCEYLRTNIIARVNATLPARTVSNDHTPKLPKDLETLLQYYCFLNCSLYLIRLNNIFSLYRSTFPVIPVLPLTLSSCWIDNFNKLFCTLLQASKSLRGLHLLKEKEFQDSSIKTYVETRDLNFDTDISSFINSALSRSCRRIVLDRIYIDHPTASHLLTDSKDISDAVVDHFQTAVPIKSTSPSHISELPNRWHSEYSPMDTISPDIYSSLLSPSSLEEWLSTVSSMPNGKAPGHSMITYEMLKHLGPATNSLLLILIRKYFTSADIPNLWRQAMVFPIPKPHEWRRTCRDPIITLESIIYDANHNNSPLWILSQDISKVFDSVNLSMLKFALERIRLPASAIMLILSLFMNCCNWVFTAHGDTSSYWVRIGIDQGEVISPLFWVIYIDPLLTVLKKEIIDPYILRSLTLLLTTTDDTSNIAINNLVFMDDSTLISSSKAGLEHMLTITEEFYALNNTSANHQKYILISNSLPLTTTSTIFPMDFDLQLSILNHLSSISVTPISITSSFHFLGVWFNLKGSRDFVKKQIASEYNSFAATLRPARLSAKQVVYLYNTVLIPKLEYRMQVTHLSDKDYYTATRLIRSLVKQKANFSCSLPNSILYLSQALGLINLFSHMIQCHVNNLFLMANFSILLIQRLFTYRLRLIQYRFLIPLSPLMVNDWSLWSNINIFKYLTLPGHTPLYLYMSPKVFKACLKVLRKRYLYYLSQLITPSGSHLISWTTYQSAYIAQLADKCGRSLPHKWYLDIKANTTLSDSHDHLYDRYVFFPLLFLPSI
ncbi:hypothetical protein RclHR1_22850001 [Rhizophagus clarus]|uniref:Reverse transcriptase domain-containing protein n=1 Tax=Rhizophagus clarus TaxID=94130 RepID=A0A2Z6QVS1_9GLOM|nr:hypothetical protein RclHR1_22850001 [Rhizophagus clarus]